VDILQPLFGSRRVVPINCEPLVWGMGAIHCVSQQQPQSIVKGTVQDIIRMALTKPSA
jgi:hypothetical protein